MAKASGEGTGGQNLTLTEVAKRTGISMPTLQKYKKRFSDRIPSVGKGRAQRYPESSLAVFAKLRDENMSRRGRPRKDPAAAARATRRRGAAKGRRAGAAGKGEGEGLLTLTQIAQRTGISYPTLMRYVKMHPERLPHVGAGRRRRFKPEAVAAFAQMRGESRTGRRPGSGKGVAAGRRGRRGAAVLAAAAAGRGRGRAGGGDMAGLQAILKRLELRLARVEEQLKKPLRVEVRR